MDDDVGGVLGVERGAGRRGVGEVDLERAVAVLEREHAGPVLRAPVREHRGHAAPRELREHRAADRAGAAEDEGAARRRGDHARLHRYSSSSSIEVTKVSRIASGMVNRGSTRRMLQSWQHAKQ